MRSTVIGFIIAPFIIYLALADAIPNVFLLLNLVGMLVVVGGTISAGIMTYGLKEIMRFFKLTLKVFAKPKSSSENVISEIIRISDSIEKNPAAVSSFQNQDIHPFLKDGLRLIENGFTDEDISEIMNNDVEKTYDRQMAEVELLKTLAKYPPAFGMIGTVIGLIGLLNAMSTESQGAAGNIIGPSMAIALLTTLYGLILANYFFVPLSDNLLQRLYHEINIRKMIIEGVILMQKKCDPIYIREYLVVNLKPEARKDILVGTIQ